MKTLLLDTVDWDLVIDADGDIAVAGDPYSQAQDAASAIRLFLGELYYDTIKGVPYFPDILGRGAPISLMRAKFTTAALTVPGVTAARTVISGVRGRRVTGQVQITNATGAAEIAAF